MKTITVHIRLEGRRFEEWVERNDDEVVALRLLADHIEKVRKYGKKVA